MSSTTIAVQLDGLLQDIRREHPAWSQETIISRLRRSMSDYAHGIWRVAMAFNQGESELASPLRERFADRVQVGAPDSVAGLADLQGDMDGDNIARHVPEGQAATAVVAYYSGDETFMGGVTIRLRGIWDCWMRKEPWA